MVVVKVGKFTGQGICSIVDSFWMVLAAKWRYPEKKTWISNQSERCIQILSCIVYNDHAYPGQLITAKVEKAGGRLGQSVHCYWIVSSTLCSSVGHFWLSPLLRVVGVLKYCWWWLVCACVKGAAEPNSTTNWLKQPEDRRPEDQETKGPGNQGPGDQGTRGPRGLGDQETKKTRRPKAQGTRGPKEPEDQ